MSEPLDRDKVIELLNRLGSEQDEVSLEAARQVHAAVTAAGLTWDDLLVPDVHEDGNGGDVDQDTEDDTAEPPAETAAKDDAASLALIDELLAKPGISDDLREELEDYKTDIAEGEFEEADRRYLRAVHQRLSKPR